MDHPQGARRTYPKLPPIIGFLRYTSGVFNILYINILISVKKF